MLGDRALYVGGGLDVRPLRRLCNVRSFVYFDARPRATAEELDASMSSAGFGCVGAEDLEVPGLEAPGRRRYVGERDRAVDYYLGCPVPEANELVRLAAADCDVLLCARHDPHASLLDVLPDGCRVFVGLYDTCYAEGVCEEGRVVRTLYDRPEAMRRYWVMDQDGALTLCRGMAGVAQAVFGMRWGSGVDLL